VRSANNATSGRDKFVFLPIDAASLNIARSATLFGGADVRTAALLRKL
jgi:hypothetical protein